LRDGSRYYFDRQQAALAIFMYAFEKTLREEEPRVPEFIRVVLEEAANPRAVLETFRTGDPSKMFCDPVDLLLISAQISKPQILLALCNRG